MSREHRSSTAASKGRRTGLGGGGSDACSGEGRRRAREGGVLALQHEQPFSNAYIRW